jgi:predicted RNA-binding Zn ribbon-like protein
LLRYNWRMPEINPQLQTLRLVGGRLCLDFVNTVDSHLKPQPKEYLHSYADLVAWSLRLGALEEGAAAQLIAHAEASLQPAEAVLAEARTLRGALFDVFRALSLAQVPPATGLAALNRVLAATPAQPQLVAKAGGVSWGAEVGPSALAQVLWPIAWSAATLLTSAEAAQLRQCAGHGCSWMFLDTTPNRSRRWCSMEECGNRAKARRHYDRARTKVVR